MHEANCIFIDSQGRKAMRVFVSITPNPSHSPGGLQPSDFRNLQVTIPTVCNPCLGLCVWLGHAPGVPCFCCQVYLHSELCYTATASATAAVAVAVAVTGPSLS
jgi:hypothetical protein